MIHFLRGKACSENIPRWETPLASDWGRSNLPLWTEGIAAELENGKMLEKLNVEMHLLFYMGGQISASSRTSECRKVKHNLYVCMRFNWLPLWRADAERFVWPSPNKILKNFYFWAAMSEGYSKVQGGQFLPLFRVSATTGIFQPRVCLPDTWNEESLITFYWILKEYK